jgi:predicted nucleic acid-binding protein
MESAVSAQAGGDFGDAMGHAMPIKDSLIAASAIAHKLTVAARNSRDFKNDKVNLINILETDCLPLP